MPAPAGWPLSSVPFSCSSSHQSLCFIDGAARNTHFACDFRGRETCSKFGLDSGHVDLGNPSAVNTTALGSDDAFDLALPAQIGFELGKNAEHVKEGLAGRLNLGNKARVTGSGDVSERAIC